MFANYSFSCELKNISQLGGIGIDNWLCARHILLSPHAFLIYSSKWSETGWCDGSVQFKRAASCSRVGPQAGGGAALRQLFLGPAAALGADLQVENVVVAGFLVNNSGILGLEEGRVAVGWWWLGLGWRWCGRGGIKWRNKVLCSHRSHLLEDCQAPA